MPHPVRFGVHYDFRNPPGSGVSSADLYARTLEQIRHVDALGFDSVWMSEHHFVEDGYMPSLIAMSGAIAAATQRVEIGQAVLLLPFQHPLRLAEDLAVLDNLSGGRMLLGAGLGYVREEFRALGVPRANRVSLTEECLEILRLAWSGEEFSYEGKRYRVEKIRVRPRPVRTGGPPIFVAAMSEQGAHRAARFGAHLLPQGDRAAVLDPWLEAVAERGEVPESYRVGVIRGFQVAVRPAHLRQVDLRVGGPHDRAARRGSGLRPGDSAERLLRNARAVHRRDRALPARVPRHRPDHPRRLSRRSSGGRGAEPGALRPRRDSALSRGELSHVAS
jgi:alkanesulfonate monooxygenase SsuD/methylene tetrahydromethanopterin reductase-like flavin-dependent oxidoreductase (luciferase family)